MEKEMGKAFLTCLAPFRHPEERKSSSLIVITDNDAAAMFALLEYDVQKLQKALSGNSLTLQWCTDTLILLKKMHCQLLLLFQGLNVSMSWNGASKLLDEYMNESINILELCNLLKFAASEMNRRLIMIDFAGRSFCDDEYFAQIQKLERKEKNIHNSSNWKNDDVFKAMAKNKYKNGSPNVISTVRGAMNVISSILFCAILYPVPVDVDNDMCCELPQMKSFVNSVQDLARCFRNKAEMASGNLFLAFVEYEMVEKAITYAKEQLRKQSVMDGEKLERSEVSPLQKTEALKSGLEVFESEITEVFEVVLRGRNNLLQQITASRTT